MDPGSYRVWHFPSFGPRLLAAGSRWRWFGGFVSAQLLWVVTRQSVDLGLGWQYGQLRSWILCGVSTPGKLARERRLRPALGDMRLEAAEVVSKLGEMMASRNSQAELRQGLWWDVPTGAWSRAHVDAGSFVLKNTSLFAKQGNAWCMRTELNFWDCSFSDLQIKCAWNLFIACFFPF